MGEPESTRAGSLRRSPVQQRSTERVGRMLEACAALLDEVGYEELSTTAIAKRAGVAVGSLYQFFPDKRAAQLMRWIEVSVVRRPRIVHGHPGEPGQHRAIVDAGPAPPPVEVISV